MKRPHISRGGGSWWFMLQEKNFTENSANPGVSTQVGVSTCPRWGDCDRCGHEVKFAKHIIKSWGISKIIGERNYLSCRASGTLIWLVVWTPLKNISQLGWLFPIYGKRKNVPNHQPVMNELPICCFTCSPPSVRYVFLGIRLVDWCPHKFPHG